MYISESDKAMIRQLVEKQLQAFGQDDEETAFALTSPIIQRKFARKDFINILGDKYISLIKPRAIIFRGFTIVDNYPALVSTIMDRQGNIAQGIFVVQRQSDDTWRIHGYELVSLNEKII
jgi:hypothetical protein